MFQSSIWGNFCSLSMFFFFVRLFFFFKIWQPQNIVFPCDKQIRFLQIKPEAIISSASHMINFHTYLCIMRTGLLPLSTNMRMIHTSSLLRTLSFNDGTARWLFFYALSYFSIYGVKWKGLRQILWRGYLSHEKHKSAGEHSVDLRVD